MTYLTATARNKALVSAAQANRPADRMFQALSTIKYNNQFGYDALQDLVHSTEEAVARCCCVAGAPRLLHTVTRCGQRRPNMPLLDLEQKKRIATGW